MQYKLFRLGKLTLGRHRVRDANWGFWVVVRARTDRGLVPVAHTLGRADPITAASNREVFVVVSRRRRRVRFADVKLGRSLQFIYFLQRGGRWRHESGRETHFFRVPVRSRLPHLARALRFARVRPNVLEARRASRLAGILAGLGKFYQS